MKRLLALIHRLTAPNGQEAAPAAVIAAAPATPKELPKISELTIADAYAFDPEHVDIVGITKRYDQASDTCTYILGRPGEAPIGLLALLTDRVHDMQQSALGRWLAAQDCCAASSLSVRTADGDISMHPLLVQAEQCAWQLNNCLREFSVAASCFCDTLDGYASLRLSSFLALDEAGKPYFASTERRAYRQAAADYLMQIERTLASALETAGLELSADRKRVLLPGFPAIRLIDTEASAF